ncbi:MAG: hypothetical protein IJS32_09750 [Kiritimatiellae bacterium]|nr:hypothetical protein [Kiritimatiellia bacterium]
MKKTIAVSLCCLSVLSASAAEELAPAAAPVGRLVVVAGPGASSAAAESAAAFLSENTSVAVAALEGEPAAGDWVIELVDDPDAPLGEVVPPRTTLNLARLRFGDPDDAKLARRTGQALCRSLASLFGEEPCVIPLCVLWRDKPSLHDLDDVPSGNYCPPCRTRMEAAARARGLEMQSDPCGLPAAEEPAPEAVPEPAAEKI